MTPVSTTPRPPTSETAEPVALPLGVRFDTHRAELADDVSLLAVINVLLRQRALILLLPIALGAIAAAIALSRPRQYTATASFMPQRPNTPASGGLGSLAAQLGVLVPSGRPNESPAFYNDLIRSRAILEPVLATTFTVERNGQTRRGTIPDLYEIKGSGAARHEAALRRLRGAVDVSTSRTTEIVRVSATAPWPELSQQITARVLALLNQFNLNTRQTQAGEERRFVQSRLEGARSELREAENQLQNFLQRNRGEFFNAPQLQLTRDRLERDVIWRQQVFTSLAQAFEQARIDEVRNTPVITLIEAPLAPVRADGRGTTKWGASAFALGLVLSVMLAFTLELSRQARLRPSEDAQEFARLRTEALRDLRRPWRLIRRARARH